MGCTDVIAAGVPRTSPVAVAVIPASAVSPNADVHSKLGRDTCTYVAVMATSYAQSADCINGELPSMACKYTVALDSYHEFVDPFPLSKYRTEYSKADYDAGLVSAANIAAHDSVWRNYGHLVVCADQIQRNTECYVLKTRILVELQGTRDTYLDPPTPIPNSFGVVHAGNRRLEEWPANPSHETSAIEGQINNGDIVQNSPGDSSMNQLISSNSTNISVNTQRVAALELLAGQLKTHAGTLSFDQHISDPTHTLHGRIMTNETELETLSNHVTSLMAPPIWEPLSALSWTDDGLPIVGGGTNNILRSGCTGNDNFWQVASLSVKDYGGGVLHVQMRGHIIFPSGTSGTILALQIPTIFRPSKPTQFCVPARGGTNGVVIVQVRDTGPVYVTSIDADPSDTSCFLDTMSWYTI